MILMAIAGLTMAGGLGLLFVLCLWPGPRPLRSDLPLVVSLGIGVGLGLTSQLFFWCSLFTLNPRPWIVGMETAAMVACMLWFRRRGAAQRSTGATSVGESVANVGQARRSIWFWLVVAAFVQVCVAAGAITIAGYHGSPHGNIDGWAIWTMHARFMWLGGPEWPQTLANPGLDWSHPDYPLLISGSIARGWTFTGAETPLVPGMISIGFAFGTVALLVAGVGRIKGIMAAMLGGLMLLGTPFFLVSVTNQYADIPLGFYMLGTVVVLRIASTRSNASGLFGLAGLMAGLAAWTKNEGLLFCLILLPVVGWVQFRRRALAEFGFLFGAWAAAVVALLYFKVGLAAPNDLITAENSGAIDRLLQWERHRTILLGWWMELGRWSWGPWLWGVLVLGMLGPDWRGRLTGMVTGVEFAVLGLMHAGYYCVYLITPHDLRWHVASSLDRLFLQLWPLTLFVWCMTLACDQTFTAGADPRPIAWRNRPRIWLTYGAVNLATAAALVAWMWR